MYLVIGLLRRTRVSASQLSLVVDCLKIHIDTNIDMYQYRYVYIGLTSDIKSGSNWCFSSVAFFSRNTARLLNVSKRVNVKCQVTRLCHFSRLHRHTYNVKELRTCVYLISVCWIPVVTYVMLLPNRRTH